MSPPAHLPGGGHVVTSWSWLRRHIEPSIAIACHLTLIPPFLFVRPCRFIAQHCFPHGKQAFRQLPHDKHTMEAMRPTLECAVANVVLSNVPLRPTLDMLRQHMCACILSVDGVLCTLIVDDVNGVGSGGLTGLPHVLVSLHARCSWRPHAFVCIYLRTHVRVHQ